MDKLAFDLGRALFGGTTRHPTEEVTGLGTMVSIFVSNAIILAGIIFFFMIIYAGIQILTAAGQKNAQGMENAKKTLTTSFIGFSLVLGSFFIVRIIEQITALDIL
ncbi:MAG: hypothetical protein NZM26_04415 [Patescibacteria group bacterium]|nr:hypothetical protein [Patescibacteria group bacterium]